MSILKEKFFYYLGHQWYISDPNKDIDNKGTVQRFSESVWDYWDSQFEPIVSNIVAVIISPTTCDIGILEPIEYSLGVKQSNLSLYSTEYVRRLIALYMRRLVEIKGTKKCFNVLFNMIGFDCDITEDFTEYSLDSAITFDDPTRVFDVGKCNPCSRFSIELTSRENAPGTPLTDAENAAANSIIEFCTPINAILTSVTIL